MSEQMTERKLTIKDLNTSYFMFEVFAQACCSYGTSAGSWIFLRDEKCNR